MSCVITYTLSTTNQGRIYTFEVENQLWKACVSNDKEELKRAEMSCYWKENPRGDHLGISSSIRRKVGQSQEDNQSCLPSSEVEGSTYRTHDEKTGVRQERDPIERIRKLILAHDLATASDLKDIEKEVSKQVDEAIAQAKESPMPDPSELFPNVYVKDWSDHNLQDTHLQSYLHPFISIEVQRERHSHVYRIAAVTAKGKEGWQALQNLQMHLRRHKVPWKLRKRETPKMRNNVLVCKCWAAASHPSYASVGLIHLRASLGLEIS
ncbi:hypothetical protein MRB53_032354 [Persea americana]|uniref:Uncharacterized protein n=1 Tax=Persea americana TaxID=3435 RepID=A0ACC2KRL3_PERAE|nr:hypothetical protein MRB53_032354 [Persea americana]